MTDAKVDKVPGWSQRAKALYKILRPSGSSVPPPNWVNTLKFFGLEDIIKGIDFETDQNKGPVLRLYDKQKKLVALNQGTIKPMYWPLKIYGDPNDTISTKNAKEWSRDVTEGELKQLKAAALETLKEDAGAVFESVKKDGSPEDDSKVKEFSGQRGNLLIDQKAEQFLELVLPFYLGGSSDALIEKLEKLADEESANVAAESNDGGTTSQGATNSQSGGSAKKTNRPTDEGAEKPKSGDDRKQTNQPASSPNPEGGARSAAQTDALVAQYAKTKEQLRNQQATGRELAVLRNTLRYLFESLERVLTRAELEERLNSPHDDEGVESA